MIWNILLIVVICYLILGYVILLRIKKKYPSRYKTEANNIVVTSPDASKTMLLGNKTSRLLYDMTFCLVWWHGLKEYRSAKDAKNKRKHRTNKGARTAH